MRSKEVTLRAFLLNHDEKTATFARLDKHLDKFTNSFLRDYFPGQNKTINENTFKVRLDYRYLCYKDKGCQIFADIQDLIDQHVTIKVLVKHYYFSIKGIDGETKKIAGWHMTLLEAISLS
jgi:hypothetical protein